MWTYIFGAICPKKGKGAGLVESGGAKVGHGSGGIMLLRAE